MNTGFVYLATMSCIRTENVYYVNTYLSLYFTESSVICVLQADSGNDDRCNGKTYLSGRYVDTHLINMYEGQLEPMSWPYTRVKVKAIIPYVQAQGNKQRERPQLHIKVEKHTRKPNS